MVIRDALCKEFQVPLSGLSDVFELGLGLFSLVLIAETHELARMCH